MIIILFILGFRQKSNSIGCIHEPYEDIAKINEPTYINEIDIQNENDSYYNITNDYCPLKYISENNHSASNSGDGESTKSTSMESNQSIESYESFKSDPYPSAITVKYSARIYGILMKRDKILFVDHSKKYWVAVMSSAMYVYNGEKELKPCLVVNLEGYTAREAIGGNRNKTWSFEVVCPGKKSYQVIVFIFIFIVLDFERKDLIEWKVDGNWRKVEKTWLTVNII